MIKPNPLNKGDKVALIATSGSIDQSRIEPAINSLKNLGLEVIIGESCKSTYGYLAGSDDLRANDLNKMFADSRIKGIFVIRGGYGASRILDKIDFKMIRKNPKIFAGYSDVTILHIALNQKCKLVTYHAPMAGTELYNGVDEFTINMFKSFMFSEYENYEINNPDSNNFESIYPGIAKGILTGGNLSLICSTLGTKYEIDTKNKILFIEEIGEEPYKIDRMLTQLIQSNKISNSSGIILGSFTECDPSNPTKSLLLDDMLKEKLISFKKPILSKVCCGHCLPTLTLPFGSKVILDCTENKKILISK